MNYIATLKVKEIRYYIKFVEGKGNAFICEGLQSNATIFADPILLIKKIKTLPEDIAGRTTVLPIEETNATMFYKIRPKTKMYRSLAGNVKDKYSLKKPKCVSTIFVIDKNEENKKILASFNGAPAQWFDKSNYCRWSFTNPLN